MPQPRSDPSRTLPRPLVFLGSLAVAGHLFAVVSLALAAPSGPWPMQMGNSNAFGPQFARNVDETVGPKYLSPLKMTYNYHSPTNRPETPVVYLEVRLKDKSGRLMKTVRIPETGANYWVRHREELLARALGEDEIVEPRTSERIPAPNQKVRTVEIWESVKENKLELREVPEHLIPRDRVVWKPSPLARVLARSYVRHLCRVHGAASGELIRHHKDPVLSAMMFVPEPPASTFAETTSNFGEIKP